jgi:hypothetical protein
MISDEYIEYLVIESSLRIYGRIDITPEERSELFDNHIQPAFPNGLDTKGSEEARQKLLNMIALKAIEKLEEIEKLMAKKCH